MKHHPSETVNLLQVDAQYSTTKDIVWLVLPSIFSEASWQHLLQPLGRSFKIQIYPEVYFSVHSEKNAAI